MDRPPWFLPVPAGLAAAAASLQLGRVTSVQDPDSQGRVEVEMLSLPADPLPRAWARVAVPFAGDQHGAWLIPSVGDQVVLAFVGGDARVPVVLGSLWHGQATPPLQPDGSEIKTWELRGRNQTRLTLTEASQSTIELETSGGVKLTLADDGSGKCQLDCGATTITIDAAGVKIQTSGKLEATASSVKVSAATVNVDTALATFSGVVKCEVLQASSVISASYTPGAGNIW